MEIHKLGKLYPIDNITYFKNVKLQIQLNMQKTQALRALQSLVINCVNCEKQWVAYSLFMLNDKKVVCRQCLINNSALLYNLQNHYSQYALSLIEEIPTPHFESAKSCIELIIYIRQTLSKTVDQIRRSLEKFQFEVYDYCKQTQILCQGYIKKLQKYENFKIETLTNNNYEQQLNQQKYLINIHTHFQHLSMIKQQIIKLHLELPQINTIRTGRSYKQQTLTDNIPITACIYVKGKQYFGTAEGKVIYWDNSQINVHQAHNGYLRSFAYDNQFTLFTGSDDFTIKGWDIRSNKLKFINQFKMKQFGNSYHRNIVIINHGLLLASTRGQFDQYKIRIWNIQQYEHYSCLSGHTNYIKGLISLKDKYLISISDDYTLKIWCYKTSKCVYTLNHRTKFNNIMKNQNDSIVALTDQENRVTLLETQNFNIIMSWCMNKKITASQGGKDIYLIIDRHIHIYNWFGEKLQTVLDIQSNFRIHNIIQAGNQLILLNGTGTIIKFSLLF